MEPPRGGFSSFEPPNMTPTYVSVRAPQRRPITSGSHRALPLRCYSTAAARLGFEGAQPIAGDPAGRGRPSAGCRAARRRKGDASRQGASTGAGLRTTPYSPPSQIAMIRIAPAIGSAANRYGSSCVGQMPCAIIETALASR